MNTIRTVLSKRDQQDLERLERIVRAGIGAFHEVGTALLEIRDQQLYRGTHRTFPDYCRERWGFAKSQAYRLIMAAEVVQEIAGASPIGDVSGESETPLPANEAQTRALAELPAGQRAAVWQEAVEQAEGAQPAAADVAALVEEAQAALPAETQLRVIAQEEEQILRRAAGRASRDERSGRTKRLERIAYHLRQAVRLVTGLGGDEGQEVIELVEQAQAALAELDAA